MMSLDAKSCGCAQDLKIVYGTFNYTRFPPKSDQKSVTGSDATSAFAGVGKKRAYDILEDSEIHQESLSQLGQIAVTEDVIKQCVKFVLSLCPTTKKTPSSMDSKALPPTSDSFMQH